MSNLTTIPSQPQAISFEKFLKAQLKVYQEWYIPNREQGVSEIELEYYSYVLMIEEAQKQVDGLKERRIQFLRTTNYKTYLKSEHWNTVRKMMLEYADHRCQLCNSSDRVLHVHHRTYENRGCETVKDLIVLCDQCHSEFHDKLELAK